MMLLSQLLFTVLASAPPQSDPELFRYEVQPGESCAAIAGRFFGSRKRYDLIHKHNPGMGPTPHKLVPGTILLLPKPKGSGPDAEVTARSRQVQARSPKDEAWTDAVTGFDLWRGWRVNTLERASAEVTFRDTSKVWMRENTLVIIYGSTAGKSRARATGTKAQLDRGALRSRLDELAGLTVETPSAQAELRGGDVLVTVDDAGTSRVANHGTGKAEVRGRGVSRKKRVRLPSGTGSKVRRGKAPSPPRPLPATPIWDTANSTRFVVPHDGGGTFRGAWTSVDEAVSYRVEIGLQKAGGFTLSSVTVPANATRFEAHNLPAGTYFATVSAIDDDKFESKPSRLYKAELVPVTLTGPDGGAVPIPAASGDELAPPTPLTVLPGTTVAAPAGVSCQLPAEVGVQALSCTDKAGAPIPSFPLNVAELNGKVKGTQPPVELRVGDVREIELEVQGAPEMPEGLEVVGFGGVEVTAFKKVDATRWSLRVRGVETNKNSGVRLVPLARPQTALLSYPVRVSAASRRKPRQADDSDDSWIVGLAPTRHMFAVGGYAGIAFPSPRHGLFQVDQSRPEQGFVPLAPAAFSGGFRLGYFPLRHFGVEGEAGALPSVTSEGDRATLWTLKASAVGQLGFWPVTPFVAGGVGTTGVVSDRDVLGRDADLAFHVGGGLKLYLTKRVALRLEGRDVLTSDRGVRGAIAHHPEVLLGVSFTFNRPK